MRRTWSTFLGQFGLFAVVETANELVRDATSERGGRTGIENAQGVAAFERAHGFFVEPAWQRAIEHTYHPLGIGIGWSQLSTLANLLYAWGHPVIIVLAVLWVFCFRTDLYSRVRNTIFVCDALALIGYRLYPLAPPRMTPGLTYEGRPFHFVDSVAQLIPSQAGNDEFAAMPSVHICYALIVALALAWSLHPWPLRAAPFFYPAIMLWAVVVTGNHYIMDAVGGAAVLCLGVSAALVLERLRDGRAAGQERSSDPRVGAG